VLSEIDNIEIRELKLRRKKEGKGTIYVITLPKAWIKKLGEGDVKAIADFRERAILLIFSKKG
jgi:hypothetical protein